MRGTPFERFEPGRGPEHSCRRISSSSAGLTTRTLAIKTLGLKPHPELYQRLADLREKMGRLDEAQAWHRLVLRDSPDDALSLAALERLK